MKNVADIYALSPMQELMLLHALLTEQNDDVLFNQIVYRIDGPLDTAALRASWQFVIDRHPALRTIFIWQKSKDPVQIVRERVTLPWTEEDWGHLAAAEQEEQLKTWLAADRAAGFALQKAPLMRLTTIQLSPDAHWLVWSSHHLINDRWCVGLILDEVAAVYNKHLHQETPYLPPVPGFKTYIGWLAKQDDDAARRFWSAHLQNLAAQPLPLTQTDKSGLELIQHRIETDQSRRLRRFAVEHEVTLGALISAAWSLVVSAVTDQDDVLFGMTLSGRPAELPGVTGIVGSFINNVPLRLQLPEHETTVVWLRQVQDRQLALQEFEHNSPAQIKEWSGLQSAGPLFDSLVVVQSPVQYQTMEKLTVQFAYGRLQTGYPLSVALESDTDQLQLTITYDQSQVSAAMAEQLMEALQAALGFILSRPDESPVNLRRSLKPAIATTAAPDSPAYAAEQAGADYTPPDDHLENQLVEIWETVLQRQPIGIHDNYFDLGADSVQTVALFNQIKKVFGKSLPVGTIFQAQTVSELAALLRAEGAETAVSTLVPISASGSKPPFFCVHGGAGHVYHYRPLAHHLAADRPFYGIQPAHRDGEPILGGDVRAIATNYVDEIRRVQPHGPYYLGGFCFGGVVAFEMAQQLKQAGEDVALVAIIDAFSPDFEEPNGNGKGESLQSRLQRHLDGLAAEPTGKEKLGYVWRSLYGRFNTSILDPLRQNREKEHHPEPEQEINEQQPDTELLPSDLHDQQMLSASSTAYETYRPTPYPGDLTIFRRTENTTGFPPHLGWRGLATGKLLIHKIPGYHMDLLKEPSVKILADLLQQSLDQGETAS